MGPLTDNGGATKTKRPAKTSAAIDAIPSGSGHCDRDTTDQRGVSRPQGPRCDIGSVEIAQKPITIAPKTIPHGRVASPYKVRLSASGGLGKPYHFALARGSQRLPAGIGLNASGLIRGKPTTTGPYELTISVDGRARKTYHLVIDNRHRHRARLVST